MRENKWKSYQRNLTPVFNIAGSALIIDKIRGASLRLIHSRFITAAAFALSLQSLPLLLQLFPVLTHLVAAAEAAAVASLSCTGSRRQERGKENNNKSVQTTMRLRWEFWDILGHFGTIRKTF